MSLLVKLESKISGDTLLNDNYYVSICRNESTSIKLKKN